MDHDNKLDSLFKKLEIQLKEFERNLRYVRIAASKIELEYKNGDIERKLDDMLSPLNISRPGAEDGKP